MRGFWELVKWLEVLLGWILGVGSKIEDEYFRGGSKDEVGIAQSFAPLNHCYFATISRF